MSVLRMLPMLVAIVALQSGPSRAQEKQKPGDAGSRLRLTLDFDALTDEWLDQQKIESRIERELWKFVSGPFNQKIVDAARGRKHYIVSLAFLHDGTLPERRLSLPAEDPEADPLALIAYTSLHTTVRQPEAVVTVFSLVRPAEPKILLTAHLRYHAETAKWQETRPKAGEAAEKPGLELSKHREDEVSLTLIQRSSNQVPKSGGTLILEIGDITGRMMIVSLRSKAQEMLVRDTPITLEETVPFELAGNKYAILLDSLENKLVGDDSATFKILNQAALEKQDGKADKNSGPRTVEFGKSIETNESGTLEVVGISALGNAELRINNRRFSLGPGRWAWLTQDEILKVVSLSENDVTIRLYHPAPFPDPF